MITAVALGGAVLAVLAFVTRDVVRQASGSGMVLVVGYAVLFGGERVLGEDPSRATVSAAGLAIVLYGVALRAFAWTRSANARRDGHRTALAWTLVSVSSLALYAATLPTVTAGLGLDEEGVQRWTGSLRSLFPIVLLLGLLPVFTVDRLLAVHPKILPAGASRAAQLQGVAGALAIALVFPLNYVAKQEEIVWDVAYFRTTRPGEATTALVAASPDPLEAVLFFPPGNETGREVENYFQDLKRQVEAGGGSLTVTRIDQALDPVRAEALKVRDNGQVVLVRGTGEESTNQKFRLDLELSKARKDLRKLDSNVGKHLTKLTRDQRVVYFLQGHGEASWRDKEDPFRAIDLFKTKVLEQGNFKVKTWSVADGSTQKMPDDASVVIVAGPTDPLLPEEIDAIRAYWNAGGSLMVLVDPNGDPMTDLGALLGVEIGDAPLAHLQQFAVRRGGGPPKDRVNLVTDKYGSHPAVKTLARVAKENPLMVPLAVSVKKSKDAADKVTTLVRTLPETFVDGNRNYEADDGETKNVYELADAVEHEVAAADGAEKTQARAIVVGSLGWMSNAAFSPPNAQFGYDSVRWLTRDEDVTGAVETEEDVEVVHTSADDWYWFLTAMLAMPTLVGIVGAVVVRSRRTR